MILSSSVLHSENRATLSEEQREQEQLRSFIEGHDKRTVSRAEYISFLKKCGELRALSDGKLLHQRIVENGFAGDRCIANHLVQMYGKCGDITRARSVFEQIQEKNSFSWNIMMNCFLRNGLLEEAERAFDRIPDRNTVSWNTMITAYGQLGHLEKARSLFDNMPQRDVASWNVIISASPGSGAIKLSQMMSQEGVSPDRITFVCVLNSCSIVRGLVYGVLLHARALASGFHSDVEIGNAIINLYSKCGRLELAKKAFEAMIERDVVSWTSIVTAHAQNGRLEEARRIFDSMPLRNIASWNTMVAAYGQAGDISEAHQHHKNIIDVLGRSGQLQLAEDFIINMPFQPGAEVWLALLAGCRMHGDLERGARIAELVHELDPEDTGAFIMLSNLYVSAGRFEDVRRTRQRMKLRGLVKQPGWSCIEVRDRVHEFMASHRAHPQLGEIHGEIERLKALVVEAGHVPDVRAALLNVEEDEKEKLLWYHSERLAIAFGLISTPEGAPLYIVKNLRVCFDCHSALKAISRVVKRKLVVKDAVRFHHIRDGVCSCGDYW